MAILAFIQYQRVIERVPFGTCLEGKQKSSKKNVGKIQSSMAQVIHALLDRADHVEELSWAAASPGSVTEVKMARQKIQDAGLADRCFCGMVVFC